MTIFFCLTRSLYIALPWTNYKTPLTTVPLLLCAYLLPQQCVLTSCYVAMDTSMTLLYSNISLLRHRVTLLPPLSCSFQEACILPFPPLWGGLPLTCKTALMSGTTMSHWLWYLSFHFGCFWHHLAFNLCRFDLVLLLSNCTQLEAAYFTCQGHAGGAPLVVCSVSSDF
jgi:hypothetical protein